MESESKAAPASPGARTPIVVATALGIGLAVAVVFAWVTSSDLAETRSVLAAREGTIKLLEARLTALQSKKPDVPVRLSMRQSALGKGKVVLFKNLLPQRLTVAATFKNANLNLEKSIRLDFLPDEEKEIGHLEGWQFESEDEITLVNQQFETKRAKVP